MDEDIAEFAQKASSWRNTVPPTRSWRSRVDDDVEAAWAASDTYDDYHEVVARLLSGICRYMGEILDRMDRES